MHWRGGGAGPSQPPLSARSALLLAAAVVACVILAAPSVCKRQKLHEAELHARGLFRSPRLGADAFIARRVRRKAGGNAGDGAGADGEWQVLLARRTREPFLGAWCVVGGFVNYMEDPTDAVRREIGEETSLGVDGASPPVFINFRGSPKRDPRAHSLSASYGVKLDASTLGRMKSGDDAGELRWFPLKDAVSGAVEFAFDHGEIVKDGAAWFEREGRRMGMYVEVVEGG